jgi:hypothetical protein
MITIMIVAVDFGLLWMLGSIWLAGWSPRKALKGVRKIKIQQRRRRDFVSGGEGHESGSEQDEDRVVGGMGSCSGSSIS